jgi:hypothetical protein
LCILVAGRRRCILGLRILGRLCILVALHWGCIGGCCRRCIGVALGWRRCIAIACLWRCYHGVRGNECRGSGKRHQRRNSGKQWLSSLDLGSGRHWRWGCRLGLGLCCLLLFGLGLAAAHVGEHRQAAAAQASEGNPQPDRQLRTPGTRRLGTRAASVQTG